MKYSIAIAAAAVALGAGPSSVSAQKDTAQEDPYANHPAGQSAAEAPPVDAADLAGKKLHDSRGRQIGTIERVAVAQDGVELAIVSIGEFLSIGEQKLAIALTDLAPSVDGSGYFIPVSAEEIEAAPETEAPPPDEE